LLTYTADKVLYLTYRRAIVTHTHKCACTYNKLVFFFLHTIEHYLAKEWYFYIFQIFYLNSIIYTRTRDDAFNPNKTLCNISTVYFSLRWLPVEQYCQLNAHGTTVASAK
jgi:hypothetical protein